MGTLGVAAALILLGGAPALAEDRGIAFLYGPQPQQTQPNSAQFLNRHFSLLEVGLMDMILLYQDPQKNSGYPFDRKAQRDAVWPQYNAALAALKQEDAARRKPNEPYVALNGDAAARFASRLRAEVFLPAAAAYLKAAPPAAATPLSDFESALLFAYLKYIPNVDDLIRGWLVVVVPQSPEERFEHELRLANCRALLRAALKAYAAHPPSGLADTKRQHEEASRLANGLIANDRAVLDPLFLQAAMTVPHKPRPAASAENPKGQPFVYRFTDQEHAVLSALTLGDHSEFDKDQKEADAPKADPAAAVRLLAKWRGRILAQAAAYADAQPQPPAGGLALERLTFFESGYVKWRLERLAPRMRDELRRLGAEADAAEKRGEEKAGDRLAMELRALVRADLGAYAKSKGGAPQERLPSWAQAHLKPQARFEDVFPAPTPTPMPGPAVPAGPPASEAAVLGGMFEPGIESAAVAWLLAQEAPEASSALALLAGRPASNPERAAAVLQWRRKAADGIKQALSGGGEAFLAGLQKAGYDKQALADYYCARSAAKPAAAAPAALEQLKGHERAAAASREAPLETASDLVRFERTPAIEALCRGAGKPENGARNAGPTTLPVREVPPPPPERVAVEPAADQKPQQADAKKNAPEKDEAAATKKIMGAAAGWGLFAILGVALGLGPFGLVGLALVGAVAGFGAAHYLSKKS